MRKKVKQMMACVLTFLLMATQLPALFGGPAYAAGGAIISTVAGNGSAGYAGDGGAATSAQLNSPEAVAFDSNGNMYIADTSNNKIRKADSSGNISTVATGLSGPKGLAIDSSGDLYIADTGNNRIVKMDSSGSVSTVAGSGISTPYAIAFDSSGNLYIADTGNTRILKMDSSGNLSTVAGTGTSISIGRPYGIAIDSSNNLYIADADNCRILKVEPSGTATTVAGTGDADYYGDGGPAISAGLDTPSGLAVDSSDNLYIADYANSSIRKVDKLTGTITTVAGKGVSGYAGDGSAATGARLNLPFGIAFDSKGNLYIADTGNHSIRKVGLSHDVNLSSLTLSSGSLSPTFAPATTSYTASVASSVNSITVTPVLSDSTATVTVNGTLVSSGSASGAISLDAGSSTIAVVVTSQDGTATRTYTVTVTRAVSLSSLTLSVGSLSPAFAPDTTSYTASVANSASSITVTPTVSDSTATVTVDGTSVSSGSASGAISLSVGSNPITVAVTSQDGTATRTYTVTVTRSPGTNASLSSLTLSAGSLSPSFAPGMTSYTASVPNSASSITITPTVSDSTATMTVNGTAVPNGTASGAISLNVGSNAPITVVVTAQDGTTTQTYTVTVTRASGSSTDANLSGLILSSGSLSPAFTPGTTSYTASVANSVYSITVTPTVSDGNATVKVGGTPIPNGTASGAISLSVGSNPITVEVTAQDGTTTRTYTVTVTRATISEANADLSSLILSNGSLSPAFAAGTTSYTASVANSVYSITTTPTVSDSNATVTVNGISVSNGTASGAISLNVGSNVITVAVTAQDGTPKTYTVTVTRASGSNASLSSLTLSSGSLSPVFASNTTSYMASVASSVSSIRITPTVSDSTSTVKVGGNAVPSGSASGAISLNGGSNPIAVVVTAQDGTTQTYTVTVERMLDVPTGLAATAGNGQVTLSWSGVSGASTYNVYQGTVPGNYGAAPIATVSGAANSYTATGLTNGTRYYFVVQASNAGGSSSDSNEASAIPQAAIAPTDLTIRTAAPVTGAAQADGTNTYNHATAVVTWSKSGGSYAPASGTFALDTVYMTKYVLTADAGYAFDPTARVYEKGKAKDLSNQITNLGIGTFTATVSTNASANDTLTIIVTWSDTYQNLVIVNLDNAAFSSFIKANYSGTAIPAEGVNIPGENDFSIELVNTSADSTVPPLQLNPALVKSIQAVDDRGRNVLLSVTPYNDHSAWGLDIKIKGDYGQTNRTVTITVSTSAANGIDTSSVSNFTSTIDFVESSRNSYPNQYNGMKYFAAGDPLTLSLSSNGIVPGGVQLIGTQTSKTVDLTTISMDTTINKFQYAFIMPNEPVKLVVKSTTDPNSAHNIQVKATIDNVVAPILSGGARFVKSTGGLPATDYVGDKVTIDLSKFADQNGSKLYKITGISVKSAFTNESLPVTQNAALVYSFIMPYNDVSVTILVEKIPGYVISTQVRSNALAKVATNVEKYFPGDTLSVTITNTSSRFPLKDVLFIRKSDNYTQTVTLGKDSDNYSSTINISKVVIPASTILHADDEITVVAEFSYDPGIPVNTTSNTGVTFAASPSVVQMSQPFTFSVNTPSDVFDSYTAQVIVTDKADVKTTFNANFAGQDSSNSDISIYSVNSDIYASGRPKSITVAVNGIKNKDPKSKSMSSISPNSQLVSLFNSIIVYGRNMDQNGEVYMGTAPNPTQRAAVSNVTSSSLVVSVPQSMLPPKDRDITYYISLNGAQRAVTIKSIETLSHTTFGVLAVVADGSNNKSVIVAANDTELNRSLNNKTKVLTIKGNVTYDPNTNKYKITGTSTINSIVTSYLPDSDSTMSVTDAGNGNFIVEAHKVQMLVGETTFASKADVRISIEKGIQYIDTYAKDPETDQLLDSNEKNIEIEVKTTLGVIALGSGLGATINGAVLLKDTIMFEGKVNMGVAVAGGDNFGIFLDAKRLEFGKDRNGNVVFKGAEAEGTVRPPLGFSKIIPGFKQSEAPDVKIEGSVNTYEKEYGIGFDLDAKIASFSSSMYLKQNNKGNFIPDTVKIIMGLKEPGIPVTPATPVGHITKIGGGFSGLADTITGNYNAIPPVSLLLNGQLDVGSVGKKVLLSFEDMELAIGPSKIQLSGNPVLLGADVFEKFQAGIYMTPSSISYDVAADARFPKNFEVIKGSGRANVTLTSNSFDVNGHLGAVIQIPKIVVFSNPIHDITIGPKTLANIDVGMSKTDAYGSFGFLGHGLGARYNYQSGNAGVSLFYANPNKMRNTAQVVDESGKIAGTYQFLPNISLVAASVSIASEPKAARVTTLSIPNQPTISSNDSDHPTVHTITFPEGMTKDYAILVTADPNDISVQDPNGNPYGLTYPRTLDDGSIFYNDPNANAAVVSDKTDNNPGTIMLNLGRQAGNWIISSSKPFASAVIAVNPIPEINSVTYAADSNTVSFALDGLNTATEEYQVEVRLSKDSGEDQLNASTGVLINTIQIDPASVVSGGVSGSSTFKPEDLTYLQSGRYYPRLTLIGIPKSNLDSAIPYSSMNAKQPLTVVNSLAPGSVSSVSVKAGGGGAIEAKWNTVSNADGYLVSLNDDQGNAVMSPLTYTDEIDNQGNVTGNQIPHPGTAIEYNITSDQAVEGVFALDFGGMQAGRDYKLVVTPYARVEKTGTYSPVIYGNPTMSNITFVPVPDYPVIHVSSDIGSMTTNAQKNNVLYVNGNFQLGISSTHVNPTDGTEQGMSSKFTVSQSDGTYDNTTGMPSFTTLYSSSDFENHISAPVSVSDTNPSSVIHVVAENQNGDKSSYELLVSFNHLPPALFVNTDATGSIYTDQNGNYQIQGSTLSNITVMDNFANRVMSDNNGNFTISGTLSSGSRVYSTITAMDAAGNFMQDDVVILKSASNNGSGSSTSGDSDDGASGTSRTNDKTPTKDTTQSSASVNVVFHDVHTEAPWAEAAIEKAYKLGIVNGRTPTAFEPNGHTRRNEAITLLVRAKKLAVGDISDLDKAASHFTDWDSVPEWSKPYLAAAYAHGLIDGSLANGAYYVHAESEITRAELAVLIQNAYKLTIDDKNIKNFNDTLPTWASESIAALASNKVINGYPDGTFMPDSSATRAEVVVMLMNVFNRQ